MNELIIFDLDGTLLNTIEDIGEACNHALEQCGYPKREMNEYNCLVGRGIDNLFRGAMPASEISDENVSKMRRAFVPYYDKHKCDKTRPYPGVVDLLKKLKEAGIRTAIASNKYQEGTERLVRHFFGFMDFVTILGQREGMPIKPSPEIVFEAMKAASCTDPDKVVYVGDSDVDMLTGGNAGVRTIGVTWGFRTREELESHNPWRIATDSEELTKYLL